MPTPWRSHIWLGVTDTRCTVVPTLLRTVASPIGPPPTSKCRMAMGPASLHLWFV